MILPDDQAGDAAQVTDEAVAVLARMAGLAIAPARLPDVAEALRGLYSYSAELAMLDLGNSEPEIQFNPRWPVEALA